MARCGVTLIVTLLNVAATVGDVGGGAWGLRASALPSRHAHDDESRGARQGRDPAEASTPALAWRPRGARGQCPPTGVGRRRPHLIDPGSVRVQDGDTFRAGDETIRLRGIDTPERGEPNAWAARRRLAELLRRGPIHVVPRAQDVYCRTVADVYVDGRNVVDVLRQEGFDKPRPPR